MDNGIYIAASGSLKQEKMMEVVANNLANVNTNGFKKDLMAFEALGADFNASRRATPEIPAIPKGHVPPEALFPTVATVKTDFSPGTLLQTGNAMDIALEGKGFLEVQTGEGLRYMRSGSFKINDKGQLMTGDGNLVMGKNGPISALPAGQAITIDAKGQMTVGGGTANTVVGNLKIVDFPDYDVLEKTGVGYYKVTGKESPVQDAKNVAVLQGALETSNVNIAKEMVSMIEVTRGYETYQKVIQSIDNLNNKAVNELSRIT